MLDLIRELPIAIGVICALVLGLAVLVSLKPLTIWKIFTALSAVSPMPFTLPIQWNQVFSLGSLAANVRYMGTLLTNFVPFALCLLSAWYAAAFLWSPAPVMAVGFILTAAATPAAILMATRAIDVGKIDILRLTMWIMAPIALIQSVATIVFRSNPALEDSYLRSPLAEMILGNDARYLFTSRPNNVTDPDKAGGLLFVNGNRASMVMAVWALIYLSLCIKKWTWSYFVLAAVCFAGSAMTNSKTAIILLIVIPIAFMILPFLLRVHINPLATLAVVGISVVAFLALLAVARSAADFFSQADTSAQDREHLWAAAARYFSDSPLAGLGFGGWADRWGDDASTVSMRADLLPHNLLIFNWANAGIIAPVLIVLVFLKLGFDYLRIIARAGSLREALTRSLQLAALTWMVAHAMFDNTELFGTSHTLPIFAVLVAMTLKRSPGDSQGEQSDPGQVAVTFEVPRTADLAS